MIVGSSLDVPWLSAATTLHLALAALVNHRFATGRFPSALAVVSALLGGAPWMFSSTVGVAAGIGVHALWLVGLRYVNGSTTVPAAAPPSPPPARATASPTRASRPADARPKGFVQTPVLSVIAESSDIKTFRLARPDGFDFTPGQFLTVRLRVDGREVVRCYSLSSAPAARGYLEISVRRQGVVSNALHALARPGSVLNVRAPAGAFTYPGGDDRPLVLIGGGIGITPLMSMVRHALLTEPTRPVSLLYSAKELGEFAFRDELLTLARRHDQLQVCFAVTRGSTQPDVYAGRIDARLIASVVPGIQHAVSMICGPQAMIDGLTDTLLALGVRKDQVRSERFEAAVAASVAKADPSAPVATAPESFQIRERRSSQSVQALRGQTLLEAADAQGLEIPSLCRAGVCGTCRTRVVEGDMRCDGGILDADDRASGYVLACVAMPQSHCVIEVA